MSSEELMQEIGDKYRLCTCNEAYISRGLNAPDCPWHSYLVQEAMEEFAIAMCEEKEREIYSQIDHEFWKDVVGYEGFYKVSNLGRVKSLTRVIKKGFVNRVATEERILNPTSNNKGYLVVPLITDGVRKVFTVHRLVAIAFLSNPDNLPVVNHKDLNTMNNKYSNLEWCTYSENIQHAHNNGGVTITGKEVIDTNTGKTYSSAKQAAIELGLSYNSLRHQLSGSQANTYGLKYTGIITKYKKPKT